MNKAVSAASAAAAAAAFSRFHSLPIRLFPISLRILTLSDTKHVMAGSDIVSEYKERKHKWINSLKEREREREFCYSILLILEGATVSLTRDMGRDEVYYYCFSMTSAAGQVNRLTACMYAIREGNNEKSQQSASLDACDERCESSFV